MSTAELTPTSYAPTRYMASPDRVGEITRMVMDLYASDMHDEESGSVDAAGGWCVRAGRFVVGTDDGARYALSVYARDSLAREHVAQVRNAWAWHREVAS